MSTHTNFSAINLAGALAPYSQATKANGVIYLSGCIAIKDGSVVGQSPDGKYDIIAQTKQALDNLETVLKASGTSKDKVLKTTVFLKNLDDFAKVNEIYGDFFNSTPRPARSCFAVAKLPLDVAIEVEAIALE